MATRRQSSDRIKLRASLPPERQETVQECPACGGEKAVPATNPAYALQMCEWCQGLGLVTIRLYKLFHRRRRLHAHYRERGLCGPWHEQDHGGSP